MDDRVAKLPPFSAAPAHAPDKADILAQDAAVDVSFAVFNDDTRIVVSRYRSSLREMLSAIDQVDGVVSMGVFWKAAADLLVARNELLQAIEDQSRLRNM